MINKLATPITFFFTLVMLLALAFPRISTIADVASLYIGFDESDPTHPTAMIAHVTKTTSLGVQPPFVPICIVDLTEITHQTVSSLPSVPITLGSWTRTERSIRVRLIDAEDLDTERRYWHLPAQSPQNSLDPTLQDMEKQVEDMDLPDDMGVQFKQRMDRMFDRGDPIPQARRDELLTLAVITMKQNHHDWGAQMLESRTASATTNSATGFARVIAYAGICVFIASTGAIATRRRLKHAPQTTAR